MFAEAPARKRQGARRQGFFREELCAQRGLPDHSAGVRNSWLGASEPPSDSDSDCGSRWAQLAGIHRPLRLPCLGRWGSTMPVSDWYKTSTSDSKRNCGKRCRSSSPPNRSKRTFAALIAEAYASMSATWGLVLSAACTPPVLVTIYTADSCLSTAHAEYVCNARRV